MSEGFAISSSVGMVFFKYCLKYKINSYEGRMEVLRRLVAKKKARYHRDVNDALEGQRVLLVKWKGKPND